MLWVVGLLLYRLPRLSDISLNPPTSSKIEASMVPRVGTMEWVFSFLLEVPQERALPDIGKHFYMRKWNETGKHWTKKMNKEFHAISVVFLQCDSCTDWRFHTWMPPSPRPWPPLFLSRIDHLELCSYTSQYTHGYCGLCLVFLIMPCVIMIWFSLYIMPHFCFFF